MYQSVKLKWKTEWTLINLETRQEEKVKIEWIDKSYYIIGFERKLTFNWTELIKADVYPWFLKQLYIDTWNLVLYKYNYNLDEYTFSDFRDKKVEISWKVYNFVELEDKYWKKISLYINKEDWTNLMVKWDTEKQEDVSSITTIQWFSKLYDENWVPINNILDDVISSISESIEWLDIFTWKTDEGKLIIINAISWETVERNWHLPQIIDAGINLWVIKENKPSE